VDFVRGDPKPLVYAEAMPEFCEYDEKAGFKNKQLARTPPGSVNELIVFLYFTRFHFPSLESHGTQDLCHKLVEDCYELETENLDPGRGSGCHTDHSFVFDAPFNGNCRTPGKPHHRAPGDNEIL
jgi:hypothetical protein